MTEPTLRDRFYTPRVAHAVTSPLGILAAGAGAAVGIAVGLPLIGAAGLGAAAYAVRVAAAVPRSKRDTSINPFNMSDPWRTFVWQAQKAQRQFAQAVARTKGGPLRERLGEIGHRIDDGVAECARIAHGGQLLSEARAQIDVTSLTAELTALGPVTALPSAAAPSSLPASTDAPEGPDPTTNTDLPAAVQPAAPGPTPTAPGLPGPSPTATQTAVALQAQLDAARRMDELIASTRDRLRLLDAQLGEAVTRAIELSVRPDGGSDLETLGADVDTLVHELESLRVALDETDVTGTR
jgi:hypothetical protein